MKQTAVQLIYEAFSASSISRFAQWMMENENALKEMDREQIEEAFINGHKDGWNFGKGKTQHFFISEIYYNETYGGNK